MIITFIGIPLKKEQNPTKFHMWWNRVEQKGINSQRGRINIWGILNICTW